MFSTATKIQIIFVLVAICAAFYVYTKCKEIDSIQNRINVMSSQLQELQTCKQANMCQVSSNSNIKSASMTSVQSASKRENVAPQNVNNSQSATSKVDGTPKHVVETIDIQIPTSSYDDEDEESICSFEIKNILKSITSFADDVCSKREPPVVVINEIETSDDVAKNGNMNNKVDGDEQDKEEEDDEENTIDVANLTDEDLAKMRVDELRDVLRAYNVETKGTRPVLLGNVKRLREKMSNNNNTNNESS